MKSLDCNTERGKIYIAEQLACQKRVESAIECELISTKTNTASDVDALMIKNKILVGLAEVKTREMGLKDGKLTTDKGDFDSYLITYEKLEKLKRLCESFKVPGYLFVSLLHTKKIVAWNICDGSGNYIANIKKEYTKTQATCNGGTAHRENAYISLETMKILPN